MPIRRLAVLTLLLLMVGGTASAASVSGSGALALAALVAEPSPLLPPGEKAVMARLLNGILTFAFPANDDSRQGRQNRLPREQCRYLVSFLRPDVPIQDHQPERVARA